MSVPTIFAGALLGVLAQVHSGAFATAEAKEVLLAGAIRDRPQDPVPAYELGKAYEAAGGQSQSALEAYREALRRDAGFARAHWRLGVLLGGMARPIEAEAELRAATGGDPELAEAFYDLGQLIESSRGRGAEALESFRQAAKLEPRNGRFRLALGMALRRSRDLPAALVELRLATQLTAKDETTWRELGLAAFDATAYPEARAALERAVALSPTDYFAWWGLGRLDLAGGQRPAAVDRLTRARALAPQDAVIARDLCEALAAGTPARASTPVLPGALDACRAAVSLAPGSAELRVATAQLLADTGDCEGARAEVAPIRGIPRVPADVSARGRDAVDTCRAGAELPGQP